ncbi:MAG: iron response transcriptional regulator IrrA [Pseudomonadota bacterium]
MAPVRPYANAYDLLKESALRPTRQRLALAKLLFDGTDRHVHAEQLHGEALAAGVQVSLATIYNTLHQFMEVGLLREVVVEAGRTYFDTNISDHHHFFCEEDGELRDISSDRLVFGRLPDPPAGKVVKRVDVIVHLGNLDD